MTVEEAFKHYREHGFPYAAPSRSLCSWERSRLSDVLSSAATRVLSTRTSALADY